MKGVVITSWTITLGVILGLILVGCGSDDPSGGKDQPEPVPAFTSFCDEHGNRVYLDPNNWPVDVVANDCY